MTESALAYEPLLFDRLKKLREWLDIANNLGIDWSKLGDIGQAVKDAVAAVGLPDQVKAWLHVLEIGATATATEADDKLVATLKKFSESSVAKIIFDLVAGWLGKATPRAMAAAESEAAALAVDWAMLLTIAKMIYDLIQSFRKKS